MALTSDVRRMVPGISRQTWLDGYLRIVTCCLCCSNTKLSMVRVRMMRPTIATRNPMMKKMRQPQSVNCSGVISDLTKITEPKPSNSPIGMANPTQAPQKARNFERAACSTTQVEAVPNSAPKLTPWHRRNTIRSTGAAAPMLS